jgi:hypothetical protein
VRFTCTHTLRNAPVGFRECLLGNVNVLPVVYRMPTVTATYYIISVYFNGGVDDYL